MAAAKSVPQRDLHHTTRAARLPNGSFAARAAITPTRRIAPTRGDVAPLRPSTESPKPVQRQGSVDSECSTNVPEEEPVVAHKKNGIIVFDWDDTLLPTACIGLERKSNETDAGSTMPSAAAFHSHGRLVEEVLRAASSIAYVSIVTLAERPWVLQSAEMYFPGIDFPALFRELNISVYYAGEHGRFPDQKQHATTLHDFQVLKRNAFACCITDWYTAGTLGSASSRLNFVSIGDSVIEQQASKELVSVWSATGTLTEQPFCKTVKLLEKPSLQLLGAELFQLLPLLPSLAHAQRSFDLSMGGAPPRAPASAADAAGTFTI